MLYRRDISLLGGGINAIKKRRSGIIKDIYESELFLDSFDKGIPCITSFYKFRGAYRIELIKDRNDEKKVFDHYFLFLRERPRFLFEYLLRLTISGLCSLAMVYILIVSIMGNADIRLFIIYFSLYLLKLFISLF